MNKGLKIGLIIGISILYLVICFASSLYIHEMTHMIQYMGIEKKSSSICVSLISGCVKDGVKGFGYYTFVPATQAGYDRGLEIAKTQEFWAYLIQTIYLMSLYGLLIYTLIQLKGG